MATLSREEAERAAQLSKRRDVLRDYLALVREGGKFQIVIPDETRPADTSGEPKLMLKMMALHDEAQALAEAEIHERIKGVEAKMMGLGVALD